MEIDRVDLHAALGNHITCHRAVNPAGQKQHAFAIGAYRHAARPWDGLGIDIDFPADFNLQHQLWIVDVYLHVREGLQDALAQCGIDFHGRYGVILSGSAGMNLKGQGLGCITSFQIGKHILHQLFKALVFPDFHWTDAYDSKYTLQSSDYFLLVALPQGFNIDAPLFFGNLKGTVNWLQGVFDLMNQGVFKQMAVLAFDADFSIFN